MTAISFTEKMLSAKEMKNCCCQAATMYLKAVYFCMY
jgi:hypothetical protein